MLQIKAVIIHPMKEGHRTMAMMFQIVVDQLHCSHCLTYSPESYNTVYQSFAFCQG